MKRIKRPLPVLCVVAVLSAGSAVIFGVSFCICMAALSVAAAVAVCLGGARKNRTLAIAAAVTALLCFVLTGLRLYYVFEPALDARGKTLEILGVIRSVTNDGGSFCYEIETDGDILPDGITVFAYKWGGDGARHDRITATVSFYPDGEDGKSVVSALRSGGFALYGTIVGQEEISAPDRLPLSVRIESLRERMNKNIRRILPNSAGSLLAKMTLGIDDGAAVSETALFRATGLSHVLSVSGLHVTVMVQFVTMLLAVFGIGRRHASAAGCIFTVFFVLLTGGAIGAVRAGVMMICSLAAKILGRENDPLNALSAAALLFAVLDPCALFSVSAWLSFSASFGIIACSDRIADAIASKIRMGGFGRAVASSVAVSGAALLFTLPVTVLVFERVPTYSLIVNLAAAPLVTPILMLGFLSELLSLVPALFHAARFIGGIAGLLMSLMVRICALFAELPGAQLDVSYGFVRIWLVASAGIFAVLSVLKAKLQERKFAAVLCAAALAVGIGSHYISMRGAAELEIAGLSGGSAVTVTSGGVSVVIAPVKSRYDASLLAGSLAGRESGTLLIATSHDSTHLLHLLQEPSVRKIPVVALDPENASDPAFTRLSAGELKPLEEGLSVELPDDVSVTMLQSGVYCIRLRGFCVLYITEACDIVSFAATSAEADIAIFDGSLPANVMRLRTRYNIYRNAHGYAPSWSENITVEYNDCVTFTVRNGAMRMQNGLLPS